MKRIYFSCKSGEFTVRGYEYSLKNNNGIPIILSHGFMANQKLLKHYAKFLANIGYVVFTFDFCGGGLLSKSDGKFSDMSLDTEKRDLQCVIDYVVKLNYVDCTKLILIGESQGGFVSCMVATELHIDKLILLYPALCIPDDARKGKMLFMQYNPKSIETTMRCKLFRFSPKYPKSAIDLDIYDTIAKISVPILIIHGSKDGIVSVDYAKKAMETAVNTNSQLIVLDGAKHGFNKRQAKLAKKHIRTFLKDE